MNFDTIKHLPQLIEPEDSAGGVLKPWVRALPLRCQGSIVTAIRGCDTASKEDNSKRLVAMVRRAVLNPADERESLATGGFFGFNAEKLTASLREFLHSMDAYPLHYIMHLAHACEIIAFFHPQISFSVFFWEVYSAICDKCHMNPENKKQLLNRMTEDRVAKGTVERDF